MCYFQVGARVSFLDDVLDDVTLTSRGSHQNLTTIMIYNFLLDINRYCDS